MLFHLDYYCNVHVEYSVSAAMLVSIITSVHFVVRRNRAADNMRLLNQIKEEYADVQIPLAVLE